MKCQCQDHLRRLLSMSTTSLETQSKTLGQEFSLVGSFLKGYLKLPFQTMPLNGSSQLLVS